MTMFLELKEKLKIIYGKYGIYILPVLKFFLALLVFTAVNGMLGYMKPLSNIFIVLILSLLCSILPLNGVAVFGSIMIVAHCFALGLEIGGIALVLFILMYLLYFRFTPRDALAVVLTPVACSFGMPCVVPLGFGLLGGPVSAVSVSLGTVTYYFLRAVKDVGEPLKQAKEQDILANIQALIRELLDNRELFVIVIASAAVVIIVSLIRRLSVDYSWYLAIGIGGLVFMAVTAGGVLFLKADVSLGVTLAGTCGACLIALILEFFCFHVDYRRTEYLEYQDDTYVYYVKAVPKAAARTRRFPQPADREQRNEQPVRFEQNDGNGGAAEKRRAYPVEEEKIPYETLARIYGDERMVSPDRLGKEAPVEEPADLPEIDFEARLEETLKEYTPGGQRRGDGTDDNL